MDPRPHRLALAQSGAFAAYCVSCAAIIWASLAAFLGVLGVASLNASMPGRGGLWWWVGMVVLVPSVGTIVWTMRRDGKAWMVVAILGGVLAVASMLLMPSGAESGNGMEGMDGMRSTDPGTGSGSMIVSGVLFWAGTLMLGAAIAAVYWRRRNPHGQASPH